MIVKFASSADSTTITAASANLVAQSINPGATTTVTITGIQSGITNVVTISVKADASSNTDPTGPKKKRRKKKKMRRAGSAQRATRGPSDIDTGGSGY